MLDKKFTYEEFNPILAKYYLHWYRSCHDSVKYCQERGNTELAMEYYKKANMYFDRINEHREELGIEG